MGQIQIFMRTSMKHVQASNVMPGGRDGGRCLEDRFPCVDCRYTVLISRSESSTRPLLDVKGKVIV